MSAAGAMVPLPLPLSSTERATRLFKRRFEHSLPVPDSEPHHSGKRTLGSNALASSSFNSSGRSSASGCDTADDLYSDASLEEDVLDLNHKVQVLQQQVGALAEQQSGADERYSRAKQDAAGLRARVLMLEEQLREAEQRGDERVQAEQRRHKELSARAEREKQLELENFAIRLQNAELENGRLREQVVQVVAERDRERARAGEALSDWESAQSQLVALREELDEQRERERRRETEHRQCEQLVEELRLELERLSAAAMRESSRVESDGDLQAALHSDVLETLETQLELVRSEARSLRSANEELQAELQALVLTRGVQEGRSLLTGMGAGVGVGVGASSASLAAELQAMSQDDTVDCALDQGSLAKMRQALKEQQEMNAQLRQYIDGILINILENYPELLEVRNRS